MKTRTINCSKQYEIMIGSGMLREAGGMIAGVLPRCRVCIVSDETVQSLYGSEHSALHQSLADAGFDVFEYAFPPGERSKNLQTVGALLDYLAQNRFSRDDALIALGGGVVGDIAGFAAAVFMRGIRFVQIPTTLLACIDASVGGKTGVDLPAGKNLAGAFWHPECVLTDTDVFATLSDALWRDGLAEIIKAGMIGDSSIIEDLAKADLGGLKTSIEDLAMRALAVKAGIVEADEREHDVRQLLNFGHTVGHAIERCSDYRITHGHAVAAGMVIEAAAAACKGWTDAENTGLLKDLLARLGYPATVLKEEILQMGPAQLADACLADKKAHGDTIHLVYPLRPGLCKTIALPVSELKGFIDLGLRSL